MEASWRNNIFIGIACCFCTIFLSLCILERMKTNGEQGEKDALSRQIKEENFEVEDVVRPKLKIDETNIEEGKYSNESALKQEILINPEENKYFKIISAIK